MSRKPKPGSIGALNTRIADLESSATSAEQQEELRTLRQQRAERKATRRTQFERDRAPLFADQIPEAKAEDYVAQDELNVQAWADLHETFRSRSASRRQAIADVVTPEQLSAMDERWRTFLGPHDPAYEATFWLERYRDTFHKNPMDVPYMAGEAWPPQKAVALDPATLDAQKQKIPSTYERIPQR